MSGLEGASGVFDAARARGLYVSLSDGWTYLNAGHRAQVPEKVSSAVSRAFRAAPLQANGVDGDEGTAVGLTRGDDYVAAARRAVADLVGSRPECVVLGPNRAALLSSLATVMPAKLRMGREVVLSRSDEPANIDPWVLAADLYGATVRWAEADLTAGTLPTWQYSDLIGWETSVVAVTAANAHLGTVTDVRRIADQLHAKSRGWLVVDATAVAPYRTIDMAGWGADVVVLDFAPLGGPEVGAMVVRDPAMLGELKLVEARTGRHSTPDPDALAARRLAALERGAVSPGLLGAVPATVDHLASLDEAATGTRRERLAVSLPGAEDYLLGLARHLVDGLQGLGGVHVIGADGEGYGSSFTGSDRVPRVSFLVPGLDAAFVGARLLDNGVVAQVVGLEDRALFDQMGVAEMGGAVCVALAPHNTRFDVDHLVRVIGGIV